MKRYQRVNEDCMNALHPLTSWSAVIIWSWWSIDMYRPYFTDHISFPSLSTTVVLIADPYPQNDFSSVVSCVVSLTKPSMSNKFWKMEPSATLQLQTTPQSRSLIGTLQDLPQLRGRQPRSLFTGCNVEVSWSTWEPNPRVPPWASKKKPIQLASSGKRFTS